MSLIYVQKQPTESSGNSKTTLEKGGRNPPDVILDFVFEDLLTYFNDLKILRETKKEIEKKYNINKEHNDCWPEDDVKRAWGKTQRIDKKNLRRNRWALVIVMQVLKIQKRQEVSDLILSEGGSLAAGGVEQPLRASIKVSKCKLAEEFNTALEREFSASSTDEAFSATEVWKKLGHAKISYCSDYGETKNAGLVNEHEDTLVNNCEQQKKIEIAELHVADVHDKENVRSEDGLLPTADINQACGKAESKKGNLESRSSQCNAELETVGAVGGLEQALGAGKKVSEASKLSDDSGAASESELSASSTDEASLSTEELENLYYCSDNSEIENAALANKNEDTLVNNYKHRKDVDDNGLYVADVHDAENEMCNNGLCSTDDINQACGKTESFKGNSEDRSSHGNDELKTETAVMGITQLSGGKCPPSNYYGQTNISSQGRTGTQFSAGSQDTGVYFGDLYRQSGTDVSARNYDEKKMKIEDEYCYIHIPLSKMFGSESTTQPPDEDTNADTNVDTKLKYSYKLIDKFPLNTDTDFVFMRKSYVISYDIHKKNAKWVYEILNRSTIPYDYKKATFKADDQIDRRQQALKSKKGFNNKHYARGHLAAAANHNWCQEALDDTYVISNMTPQIRSINNGIWKSLENYCRNKIYDDEVRNVHVYTGPLYPNNNEELKEENEKAVPTHYFKVVIVEKVNGKAQLECFMVENKETETETETPNEQGTKKKREKIDFPNSQYVKDITVIEKNSGLLFTHTKKSITNYREMVKKTVTWTGDNGRKSATIEVNIMSDIKSLE